MDIRHPIIPTLIENFPHPAVFKSAESGKYLGSNAANSMEFGVADPAQLEGLTIHDLGFTQRSWGSQYANRVVELDRRVHARRVGVKDRRPFLSYSGAVRYYEVVKFPVLDPRSHMTGIVTYAQDIQRSLCRPEQYWLYRRFYDKQEAVAQFLAHFDLSTRFSVPPGEEQLMLLLEKAEGHSDKKIGKHLELSPRLIERYMDEVRTLIVNGDLDGVLAQLTRKATLNRD